jgi:hypothetical protein
MTTIRIAIMVCTFLLGANPELHAQQSYSVGRLTSKNWNTVKHWFGDETVVLVPIASLDTADLDEVEVSLILAQDYGERIAFNPDGTVNYSNRMSCEVGEVLKDLQVFKVDQGQVHVEYMRKPWNGSWVKDTMTYDIIEWSATRIVLTTPVQRSRQKH